MKSHRLYQGRNFENSMLQGKNNGSRINRVQAVKPLNVETQSRALFSRAALCLHLLFESDLFEKVPDLPESLGNLKKLENSRLVAALSGDYITPEIFLERTCAPSVVVALMP